ncbi:MAG: class I SAM-dependent RNA methyltransferase, partial [Bacteroidales bacterium]|nr:class I SAM-dependent RNA methyltransferase [Bacteroidales bacterium]
MQTNRTIVEENYQLITKTVAGLEEVLAAEIRALGAKNVRVMHRAVICEGNKEMMYKLNYRVRTGLKVLKPYKTFFAKNPEELYKRVQEIHWWELIRTDQTFCIDAVTSGRFFTHSQYASLKAKDAIVDQFREVYDMRPSINTLNPDLRINLHIREDKVQILFDSSNESLHHRGYRKQVDKAPMNEVLAAGLIQLSGWKADCNFLDCMCGSGTLPIEAAMYAMKIPSGYYRKQWGFMKWDDWDPELWQRVKEEADNEICEFDHEIWASDRSPKAVAIAEANIANARLQHDIHLMKKNMEDLTPPEEGGIVIINPPYGDRLDEDDIDQVYENIGNTLKHNFQGYECWLITDDAVALKHVGLKPSAKIPVWNGPLECR